MFLYVDQARKVVFEINDSPYPGDRKNVRWQHLHNEGLKLWIGEGCLLEPHQVSKDQKGSSLCDEVADGFLQKKIEFRVLSDAPDPELRLGKRKAPIKQSKGKRARPAGAMAPGQDSTSELNAPSTTGSSSGNLQEECQERG